MFLESGSAPADELPVTAAAHHALVQELEKLRQEKAQYSEHLRSVADARLARLADILSRARVVGPAESTDTIAIGSSVTVLDRGVGEPYEYVIDSAHAPVSPAAVSAVSPVGRALLGRTVGDVVVVELPRKGKTRELEIVAVRPLEAP